jgi:hypothetical protein
MIILKNAHQKGEHFLFSPTNIRLQHQAIERSIIPLQNKYLPLINWYAIKFLSQNTFQFH